MSTHKKEELMVSAICDGTVLDHIPPEKLYKVVALLKLAEIDAPVTIGNNFRSGHMGKKGIIKVENKFFSDEEISRIAILAPNAHLNIIRNYQVVEKRQVLLPREIVGIVRCPNPKCICNNEPMQTRFEVTDAATETLCCRYCRRKVSGDAIELL